MKKVLILGSNGLLGQSLVKKFIKNHHVFAASFEKENYLPELNITYQSIDLKSRAQTKELLNKLKPEIIINAAGYTNVDECEVNREVCWNTNAKAVENIIESAISVKPVLVHISTDYVFDGLDAPYSESAKPNPRGNYARSKMAAENIIRLCDLEYLIVRTQVLYGTGNRIRPNFVTWVIDQLKKKNKIRIVTDQIGDPTYVPDLSEAIFRLLEAEAYGLFHVSGSESLSRYDFAIKIAKVFELDASLIEKIVTEELNQKAPRPMNSSFILNKLVNIIGWQPHDVESALNLLKHELGN